MGVRDYEQLIAFYCYADPLLSPMSPTEMTLDASLYLIDALAACVMSARLSGGHRQWAIEQLVRYFY